MPRYVFAHCDTISCRVNGYPVTIRRGEAYDDRDPVVLAHPELFRDYPLIVAAFPGWKPAEDRQVEQATSSPGEKRATRRAS
jgi:hypothetical protein